MPERKPNCRDLVNYFDGIVTKVRFTETKTQQQHAHEADILM